MEDVGKLDNGYVYSRKGGTSFTNYDLQTLLEQIFPTAKEHVERLEQDGLPNVLELAFGHGTDISLPDANIVEVNTMMLTHHYHKSQGLTALLYVSYEDAFSPLLVEFSPETGEAYSVGRQAIGFYSEDTFPLTVKQITAGGEAPSLFNDKYKFVFNGAANESTAAPVLKTLLSHLGFTFDEYLSTLGLFEREYDMEEVMTMNEINEAHAYLLPGYNFDLLPVGQFEDTINTLIEEHLDPQLHINNSSIRNSFYYEQETNLGDEEPMQYRTVDEDLNLETEPVLDEEAEKGAGSLPCANCINDMLKNTDLGLTDAQRYAIVGMMSVALEMKPSAD